MYDINKAKKRHLAAQCIQTFWRKTISKWKSIKFEDFKQLIEKNDKYNNMDSLNDNLWEMDQQIQGIYHTKVYIPALPLIIKFQKAWRRKRFSKGILKVINKVFLIPGMFKNIKNLKKKN